MAWIFYGMASHSSRTLVEDDLFPMSAYRRGRLGRSEMALVRPHRVLSTSWRSIKDGVVTAVIYHLLFHVIYFCGGRSGTAFVRHPQAVPGRFAERISSPSLDRPVTPVYYLTSTMVLAAGSGARRMFFSIDPQNGVAIYEQIVRQVKFAIAEGTLGPGQLLPSVRVLSQQLAINPNTIARAYLQLQSDEVVESLRGRGLAVCAGAPPRCRAVRQRLIAERLRSVLAEALHGGLKAAEIREIVRRELESLSGTVNTVASGPDEAAPP